LLIADSAVISRDNKALIRFFSLAVDYAHGGIAARFCDLPVGDAAKKERKMLN